MKTPRDILLAQHRAAETKLDEIRGKFVAGLNRQDAKTPRKTINWVSWLLGGSNVVWRELIFPSRRIWAGLAAVWVLLFAVNFFLRDHSPTGAMKISSPATLMTFQQQERLLAELDNFNEFYAAKPPKKFTPRPRSEWIEILAA